TSLLGGFFVQVNKTDKLLRPPPNDCQHQWQSEFGRANGGRRCTSCSQPYRKRGLIRSRIYAQVVKRWAVFTFPGQLLILGDLQQKLQLFGKKLIIIFQILAKQGEGFNKRAPSSHNLRPSVGEMVHRRKVLKNPDRIV